MKRTSTVRRLLDWLSTRDEPASHPLPRDWADLPPHHPPRS